MKRILGMVAFIFILMTESAQAITIYYRPTPYPLTISADKQHIVDGWITNMYYDRKFIQSRLLKI